MTNPNFEEIEACVFDAYGTLFDVHSAAAYLKPELGEHADQMSKIWRHKQLQYTWLRSLMGRYVDFWQVTGDALDFAMQATGIENPQLRAVRRAEWFFPSLPVQSRWIRRKGRGRLRSPSHQPIFPSSLRDRSEG